MRLFALVLISLVFQATATAREWTDKSGNYSLEAEFVELTAGKAVRLKRPEGKLVEIPLSQLSSADVDYVNAKVKAASRAAAEQEAGTPFTPVTGKAETSSDVTQQAGVRVVVTGVGLTPEAALKNAFHQAVRQVVGTLVEANVLVEKDKLVEDKVITLSGGFVKDYKSLSEKKYADGLIHIRIAANVHKRPLLSALQRANITLKPVAGDNMFAELVTKFKSKANATELVEKLLQGYPASVMRAEVVGEPRIRAGENQEAVIEYDLKISIDEKKYDAIASQLVEVLDKSVDVKGDFLWASQTSAAKARYLRSNMIDDVRSFVMWLDQATQNQIGGRQAKEGPEGKIQLGKLFSLSPAAFAEEEIFGRVWWKNWDRSKNTIPVVINSARNGLHDRTTWKWFHAPANFKVNRGANVVASFMDEQGKQVLNDQVSFQYNSPGVTIPYHNNGASIIISPFWVYDDAGYTPSVTIRRTVRLTSDEVKSLKTIRCTVTPR